MPSFFTFQQGADSRGPSHDSSPLLGRFRAVPRSHRNSLLSFSPTGRGLGIGYGSLFANRDGDGDDTDNDDGEGEDLGLLSRLGTTMRDLWVEPKQAVVARTVRRWWVRWFVLAVLPALLVSGLLIRSAFRAVTEPRECYANDIGYPDTCMVCPTIP
jgi:hypothetical protein